MSHNTPNPDNLDYGRYSGSGNRGRPRGGRSRVPSYSDTRSTHIPDTSSSPAADSTPSPTLPTQMSVEDFVALPGRERLRRLHPECAGRDTWFKESGNGITKSINRMLNGLLQHPYPTYHHMPLEDKEMWFRQFAQEFTWDSHLTAYVRSEFDRKAAIMYSRKLNEWKGKWAMNQVPRELVSNPALWNGFIAYWSEDATKSSSSIHSTCRNSDRKGKGPATHNLGATSKVTKAKQLFQEDGVQPSALRLLEVTHTNKYTHEIQDGLAREIVDNVRKMGEEFLISQPTIEGTPPFTEVPFEMMNDFVYQCTPKAKGRVFGLPDDGASSASSRFYGDPSADLRAQLASRDGEMDAMKAELQGLKYSVAAERERMEAEQRVELERIAAEQRAAQERMAEEHRAMMAKMETFMSSFQQHPPTD